MIGIGLQLGLARVPKAAPAPATPLSLIAFWDALNVPDGDVASVPDLAGNFDLTAVNAPTAVGGVITFDGVDDSLSSADVTQEYGTVIVPEMMQYVTTHALPDAQGSDPGRGFAIAGFCYDDSDGTWWAANAGKTRDGVSETGDTGGPEDVRKPTIVHLAADFSTNLGEIDLDALWENAESPQGVAVDNTNGYLWVIDGAGQKIRCLDKSTGIPVPAMDIDLSFRPGSLCSAASGDALWVMSHRDMPGDAVIQRISTDGTQTLLVSGTVPLGREQRHIFAYDGCLYVSVGRQDAQASLLGIDPTRFDTLWQALVPYPDGPDGLVGVDGIWLGPDGTCFISHDGYFDYGDPSDPVAPAQWPRDNVMVEYKIPTFGAVRDFDIFWLGAASPSGADVVFELGTILGSGKTLTTPSVGLVLMNNTSRAQIRKGIGGTFEGVTFAVEHSSETLLHFQVRGAVVTLYQDDVLVGSGSFTSAVDGSIALRRASLGGSVRAGARYLTMDLRSTGIIAGGAQDRQRFAAQLLWRHGRQDLLPSGHPYADVAP